MTASLDAGIGCESLTRRASRNLFREGHREAAVAKNKLKQIKQMIRGLSSEERQQLIPFIVELPDSGIEPSDLDAELKVIDEAWGKYNVKSEYDPEKYLFDMVFPKNFVSLRILGVEVLRVVFLQDNFAKNFYKAKTSTKPGMSEALRAYLLIEENKAQVLAARRESAAHMSEAEIESEIAELSNAMAQIIEEEKARRVAAGISSHLPRMVGDMFSAAIKGQTIADYNLLAEHLESPEKMLSTPEIKKMVTDSFWKEIKPHLGVTKGGNTRTNPAWRDESTLRQYAQKVTDRKLLATCIKDMFEECEGEAGWIADLKESSNYRLLSKEVPDEVIAWAVKRVASEELPAREREPLSIACEIARRELKLPEQSTETLRDYDGTGEKLLRQDRKQKAK